MSAVIDLVDYRRRVAEIYARVRAGGAGEDTWRQWTEERHELFATHPQSPFVDRSTFTGLDYYPYHPEWRTTARFTPVPDESVLLQHSGDGATQFVRAGTVDFEIKGAEVTFQALWLDAYGGGLFVPFQDATSGDTTYGGGRYLLDTVKGADLGEEGGRLILDFNYAYHPSCVYGDCWSCPLSPPSNRLPFPVTAGERLWRDQG